MKKFWFVLLALGLALNIGAFACSSDDDDDDGSSGDADSDSDSDADSDSDSDADGDCGQCPLNSGYPCPCDGAQCNDGSMCGGFPAPQQNTSGYGICAKVCTSPGSTAGCEVDMNCNAVGNCSLMNTQTEENLCAYTCTGHADCPADMYCDSSLGGVSVCYPY